MYINISIVGPNSRSLTVVSETGRVPPAQLFCFFIFNIIYNLQNILGIWIERAQTAALPGIYQVLFKTIMPKQIQIISFYVVIHRSKPITGRHSRQGFLTNTKKKINGKT